MKSQELINKRAKLWEEAKAFLDSHENKETGLLSAADKETYQKMENDMAEYTQAIEIAQRQEALERSMSMPTTQPLVEKPVNNVEEEKPKSFRASKAYSDAMMQAFRSKFKRISNVLQEGVDVDGGYLVPEELDRKIVDKLNEENIFRKFADVVKTGSERKINIADGDPAAAWIDEGDPLVFSDAKFKQINLDAHKLHVAIKVTEELLYDEVFDLKSYLIKKFGIALANAEEDAFLNGNGEGKPLGIFDATGGGDIGLTIDSTSIKADNIIDLIYSLRRPYRKNAKFIMNDATIACIRKLKDNNGAYLWQPSLVADEPDKIFGYPVYTSAFAPILKAGNPVMAFGDFEYYKIGDRGTRSFNELKELFAGNGMEAFVAKERVDGKLTLSEAVKIMKVNGSSSNTDEPADQG